jgi:CTP synthase (UTP-ammonia lyase)
VTDVVRVAVIGDRLARFVPQERIEAALEHSAARLGVRVDVTWHPTPDLEHDAAVRLGEADAVWCAPGGPYLSLDGALAGIRFAREQCVPFLGTCAGFQHAVLEFARNVLGEHDADHPEYQADPASSPLFLDDALCSRVGEDMKVHVTDAATRAIYGTEDAVETYYCRFAVKDEYVPALEAAGLLVAGVDDGVRIMRLADHPFFYLTLFVPQVASQPERPHPLVTGYLETAAASWNTANRASR